MRALLLSCIFLATYFLQACSGTGFHLRETIKLPKSYQTIRLENIAYGNGFVDAFEQALEESGGTLIRTANSSVSSSASTATTIYINNFREGKRIIAYTNDRKAREYLLSLKFNYTIGVDNANNTNPNNVNRINLDRVFIYDADFALGKAEEQNKIKKDLYHEAARLVLLKLKYANK